MSKTPEELEEALNKALESIKALETKNKELLTEKQKAKAAADEAREAAEEAAAEREREGKDVAAIEKRLTDKHAKEIAKLKGDLEARDAQLGTLLVDNAITASLTENNVAPQYAKAVSLLLKQGVKVENGEAVTADGQSLTDGIKAFFASDDAKPFVSAPANSGANAPGNKANINTVASNITKDNFTIDAFMALPEADKNVVATRLGMHHLVVKE